MKPGKCSLVNAEWISMCRLKSRSIVTLIVLAMSAFAPSLHARLSDEGRYVVISSDATNLVSDDSNGVADVFVHDRQTGVTERVSVDSNGNQANGESSRGFISGDGRYVSFISDASNLVSDDNNQRRDLFIHDRNTGTTIRVLEDYAGLRFFFGRISGDGRHVLFTSNASNIVDGDSSNVSQLYVYELDTGNIERVSVDNSGVQGNDTGHWLNLSDDGRYAAFSSGASNLVSGDTNESYDVFVHDRITGITERVSVGSDGVQGNSNAYEGEISGDGRYVVFSSSSNHLVSRDFNASSDVFVHDRETGITSFLPPWHRTWYLTIPMAIEMFLYTIE